MGDPNLEFWDETIKNLKSMDCESNAFNCTDYEKLNKWINSGLNRWANSGT